MRFTNFNLFNNQFYTAPVLNIYELINFIFSYLISMG